MSDQPIKVVVDGKSKVKTRSYSYPDEEMPLPLQGSIEFSLEVEANLEVEKM